MLQASNESLLGPTKRGHGVIRAVEQFLKQRSSFRSGHPVTAVAKRTDAHTHALGPHGSGPTTDSGSARPCMAKTSVNTLGVVVGKNRTCPTSSLVTSSARSSGVPLRRLLQLVPSSECAVLCLRFQVLCMILRIGI